MNATKTIAVFVIMIIMSVMFLSGCSSVQKPKAAEAHTISDIPYDVNNRYGYTVYVEEDSLYVPYLVLTDNYEGNTLLVRKDLLSKPQRFNDYFSYYEDSYIDNYLNKEFKSTLSPDMQKAIVNTRISITKESALGHCGEGVKSINRDVFLLSFAEIGLTDFNCTPKEGNALKYFPDTSSRIAKVNGKAGSWWLRTPNTCEVSSPCGVAPDGSLGSGNAYSLNGVRPAFCVRNSMHIKESDEVIKGQRVYVLIFSD